MKLNQYQTHTRETAIYPEQDALIYTVLGLTGESGEIAEKVKKLIRDDKCLTIADMPDNVRDELILELGDVLWYVSNLAYELGATLEEVAVANIQKLESRKVRGALSGSGDHR